MPYTPSVASQVLVGPVSATVQATAAQGAVGTFSYQWYRGTVYNFQPSPDTLLTGQTSLTLLDTGLTYNTIYYYIVQATDSANSNTVNSNTLGICTAQQGQMTLTNPSVAQFQDFFDRDFPFGTDIDTSVRDKDILKGFQECNNQIKVKLPWSQASYTVAYMNFSAHFMCENMLNSSQGLNGQYRWLNQSVSVGGVSESVGIPPHILENPTFAGWSKTTYGSKYLRMVWPLLIGPMGSAHGMTKP